MLDEPREIVGLEHRDECVDQEHAGEPAQERVWSQRSQRNASVLRLVPRAGRFDASEPKVVEIVSCVVIGSSAFLVVCLGGRMTTGR